MATRSDVARGGVAARVAGLMLARLCAAVLLGSWPLAAQQPPPADDKPATPAADAQPAPASDAKTDGEAKPATAAAQTAPSDLQKQAAEHPIYPPPPKASGFGFKAGDFDINLGGYIKV